MVNLYDLDEPALAALLRDWGQPAFRARQIRAWLYDRGVASFGEMTDLPRALRERLEAETTLGDLTLEEEQRSKDGTIKRVYRLHDGQLVESVLMVYEDGRRTACISSQAGCAMGCVFCATGQMGFARQLTGNEILAQAMIFDRELKARGERLSNVVLMGMGEPFHNYDAVLWAIRKMNQDVGIGARHITVSTVGLVPQIRQFAEEGLQVKLAISLHAATDAERSALLPINKRWPLADLLEACRYYAEKTGRRVSFEWALIAGRTDLPEQGDRLGRLLSGIDAHVNVIPLNPTAGYDGAPADPSRVEAFLAALAHHGVPGTIRVRRGIDIDAGCGQLKSRVERRRAAAT